MKSLNDSIQVYKKQLAKGDIQHAYLGIMNYMMKLRTHLKNKYSANAVSGNIYQGFMDMSYIVFTPAELQHKKLKIAIVFQHETASFEVWLAGNNQQMQAKYWKIIKASDWRMYPLSPLGKRVDAIIRHSLVEEPDFDELDNLTKQIEEGTLKFIEDIRNFFSKN
jgi:hypothetical protein